MYIPPIAPVLLRARKQCPPDARLPFRPAIKRAHCLFIASKKPGLLINSSVANPAAIASGLPDSVPAWYTLPSGAMRSMTSAGPPIAPTGMPPTNDLAERAQVGLNPDQFLRTTKRNPKAGHDFIENQQGAVFCAQGSKPGNETRPPA